MNGGAVINFLTALYSYEQKETAYRIYSSDALKLLIEKVSGQEVSFRYSDILNQHKKPKNNRSGNEIVADVIKKCGLVVRE